MKRKNQKLLFFFWLALAADCFFIFRGQHDYRFVTKSLLMPLLLFYFISNVSRRQHRRSRILVFIALLGAWIGDVVLLLKGETYFMVGVLFFVAMHIMYILYFIKTVSLIPEKRKQSQLWIPTLIVIAFCGFVYFLIGESLGDKKVPILFYMGVISVMFITAWNITSNKRLTSLAINYFIPGAAFFMISDSLLGYNLFLFDDHLLGIGIMLTYAYAQQLMIHGFIKHLKGV
jgi:uncharacterized membrane protein YhhN